MKRIQVAGYDTIVEFPDSVGDDEIKRVLKERFPETSEQLVARVTNPETDAESITFEDFKRFKVERPDASWGDLGSAVVTGAATVANEVADGVVAGMKQTAKGNLGTVAKSAAEGAGRGTVDVGILAARIGDHITTKLEDLVGGESEGDLEDQFNRFKAIKRLDNWREKARKGDTTVMKVFGIKAEDVDPELSEAFSYVLDPTVLTGAGLGGKVGMKAAQLAAKPVAAAGRAMEAGAGFLRRAGEKVEGGLEAATKFADDIVPGGGRYLPGAIGAGAVVSGGVGYGAAALGAIPTLELGGAIARGLSESMALAPTRTGTLARLARNAPDTWAGRAAGKLEVFDRAIEYTGRMMSGGAAGATVGAGLGFAAGGLEGAAQGLGTGLAAGSGGGVMGRAYEGLSGNALRAAESADYGRFRESVDPDTGAFLDGLGERERIQAMDLIEIGNGMAGGDTVRVLPSAKFREQFGEQVGAQVVQGERPVIYIDGGRGDMRTLSHETFHAIARLDGFDAMALKIADRIKTLHGDDAIGQFMDEYMLRLDSDARSKFAQRETKQADILEEMGAEYFAHFLTGKQSSFLVRGDGPVKTAVDAVAKRFAANKLERIAGSFESPIFDSRIKQSKAIDIAMSELAAARRRAHRAVELSTDAPVQIIGVDDLGDETKFNQLVKMGLAKTDAKGRRVLTKRGEEKKIAAATTAAVARAVESTLDTGGLVKQVDGSYAGHLSPEQFDAILGAADVPDKVKEVLKFMRANAREGRPANVTYGAATFRTKTGKVRYRNLPVSNRDVLIYETIVSPKTGTMRAKVLDMSYMHAKARREFLGSERIQREFGTVDNLVRTLHDYIRGLQSGAQPTADIVGGEAKRNILNKMLGIRNVGGNPLIPEGTGPKGGDHPWRDFRLDRVIAMRQLDGDPLSFSDAAYRRGQTNFKPGATQRIREDDIARFTPAPDNPNADIRDFIGKRVQMLTTDQSTSVDKEAGGMVVQFRGGPGYLKLFDGWAFTDKKAASGFRTRWEKDGRPFIGLTSLSPRNHLNSKLTRRYIGAKWKGAVESGQIGKTVANRHIREVMRRFLAGKNKLDAAGRKLVAGVKNYQDLGPAIEAMPWAAAGDLWAKFDGKTLPIPQEKLRELGLDTDSIATETREPAYHGVETGALLAIAEYDGTAPVYRPEINESYPWFVPLKDKAFLKDFADALELTSYPQVRAKHGGPNAHVMMVKGPILDKLESGDVRFTPATQLKAPGGAVYESPTGHRAVQTSGRAKVRVYDPAGRRIGPLFSSVEKAQDWVRKQR